MRPLSALVWVLAVSASFPALANDTSAALTTGEDILILDRHEDF